MIFPTSQLLCRVSAARTSLCSLENTRHLLNSCFKLSTQFTPGQGALRKGRTYVAYGLRKPGAPMKGTVCYASASDFDLNRVLRIHASDDDEEERLRAELTPDKLYQPGTPGTVQAVIKDVNPVGYFVTLPNGKEAYLPASELGTSGGITLMKRLYKKGDVFTVKVIKNTTGGRDTVKVKPDPVEAEGGATSSAGTTASSPSSSTGDRKSVV